MPILRSQSITISVPKGSTLVLRNLSGTETVTGSSAGREDASATLGAGAVVYGPQSIDSSLTITTAGMLDYNVVAGDATPASERNGAFYPAMPTTEGIIAAAQTAAAAGGGVVDLAGMDVTLTQSLPFLPGVIYKGGGSISYTVSGNNVLQASTTLRGGDGNFPAFAWNTTDRASAYNVGGNDGSSLTAFHLSECNGAGVQDMAILNFKDGIRAGALYEGGIVHMQFSNLIIGYCSGWGLWLENCQAGYVRDVSILGCGEGGAAFVSSAGDLPSGTVTVWNHGNYVVENLFVQNQVGAKAKTDIRTQGIIVDVRGNGSHNLNDVTFSGIQANGPALSHTQTATFNGTTCAVTDITKLSVDMGVTFSAAVGAVFKANVIYFITSITPTGGNAGTITLSNNVGGANLSLAGLSGTPTLTTKGGTLFRVGRFNKAVTYSIFSGLDFEAGGTAGVVLDSTKGCHWFFGIVPGAESVSSYAIRNLDSSNNLFTTKVTGQVDMDGASQWVGWHGPRAQTNPNSGFFGRGVMHNNGVSFSGLPFSNNNSGMLDLGGCRLLTNNTTYAGFIHPHHGWLMQQYSASSTLNNGDFQFTVCTGGAGQAITLPTLNDNWLGVPRVISNPTGNAVTINTGGGQTIDNVGGATSISIPANGKAMLIGAKTGSTYYWCRVI